MLQRIQSIFLFTTAVCMVLILFFPLWQKVDAEKSEVKSLTALSLKLEKTDIETNEVAVISEQTTVYIAVLCVLAAAVAMYSIFRFDNRLFQMKLNALNSVLMGAALGVSVYLTINANKEFLPEVNGEYLTGYFLFVGGMICNVLANRFIKNDEKLVRSADRIR